MMNENNNIIALRRLELGMSQSSISDALGYSVQAVSKWEKGKSFPGMVSWGELAKILQIDLEALLDGKAKNSYNPTCLNKSFSAEKFAENLKKQRKIRDLTQTELASLLSISYQTILIWEKGAAFPNVEQFKKLAEVLNLSYDQLYFAENDIVTTPKPDTPVVEANNSKRARKIGLFLGLIILAISAITLLVIFLNKDDVISSNNHNSVSLEVSSDVHNSNSIDDQYQVFLDVNGGDLLNEAFKEIKHNQNYTLPVPTRNGYIFLGWYDSEKQMTDENGQSLTIWDIDSNVTLVAKWKVNTKLNLVLNYVIDGTIVYKEKYSLENHLTNLYQYPTNDYFYGWYESKTFNSTDKKITSTKGLFIDDNNAYVYGTLLDTNFDFEYNDGCYLITKYNDFKTEVIIPTFINGIWCVGIKEKAFYNCYSLASIIIPSSVTSIGDGAFRNCSFLTSVVIPSSVISIGIGAFAECSSLTSIEIPSSVTSIDEEAFAFCHSLTIYCEVTSKPRGWDDKWNIDDRPVYWGVTKEEVKHQKDLQYLIINGNAVVTGCKTNSTKVIIPSTINENNMTYNVTSIGDSAFKNCILITSITLPNTLTNIEDYAFKWCSSLTSINIPSSVTSIGQSAFENCSSLKDIEIPSNVSSIGENAFASCDSLTTIEIPSNVSSIGENAFSGCNSLTIYCKASNKPSNWDDKWNYSGGGYIPVYWGINESNSLLKDGVIYVVNKGNVVVKGHKENVKEVIIPSTIVINDITYNVTSIGENAFSGCKSLTYIEIPNSVTSIGNFAFSGCDSLASILIPKSITSIGWCAFSRSNPLAIYCEASRKLSGWDDMWNIDDSPVYWGINDSNYLIQDRLIYVVENKKAIVSGHKANITEALISSSITIDGNTYSVESIGKGAFSNCSSLTSIIIPSSIINIGSDAFCNCNSLIVCCEASSKPSTWDSSWNSLDDTYMSVYWGVNLNSYFVKDDVIYIVKDNNAFVAGHKEITNEVIIPSMIVKGGNTYKVIEIGSYAFYNCKSLTSITIPSGVTSIGEWAFYDCGSLTSIVIPSSVTSIGEGAFSNCSSLNFYCEASSQPSGWFVLFSDGCGTIYWGINENNYLIQDGLIYVIKEGQAIVSGHKGNVKDVIIPSTITIGKNTYNVTRIGSYAFYNCDSLVSIDIASSVTSIGRYAFDWCDSITSITIPSSVTSIGSYAFSYCSSLALVKIPSSVISIGEEAFASCDLLTIYCETSSKPSGWHESWNASNRPVYWSKKWP